MPFINSISATGGPGGGGRGSRGAGKQRAFRVQKRKRNRFRASKAKGAIASPIPLRRWILFLEAGFEKLFRICDRIDETDSRFSPSRPSICFRGKGLMQKTFFLLSMRLFFYSQLTYFLLRRPRKNTSAGTDSVRPRLQALVGRFLSQKRVSGDIFSKMRPCVRPRSIRRFRLTKSDALREKANSRFSPSNRSICFWNLTPTVEPGPHGGPIFVSIPFFIDPSFISGPF